MTTLTAMTSRERLLAALHQQEVDRFPVWLKMAGPTWGSAQPQAIQDLSSMERFRIAGCDPIVGNQLRLPRCNPRVQVAQHRDGDQLTTITTTPDGVLRSIEEVDPATQTRHPIEYPVKTTADIAALRWCYSDTQYGPVPDTELMAHAERQRQAEADGAVTMCGIGPSPLMQLVEELIGPENAFFFLFDEPELMAELIELMHGDRCALFAAWMPHIQADTLWLTENTSTTLISPDLFRQFCMPHLRAYGQAILDAGCIPIHHMCGHIDALLEDINDLPAMANEAFTTAPVGNTSLAAGRTRMRSKALIGGTNASLLLEDVETVLAAVAADLEQCPDRRGIILTSAGVLPAAVDMAKAQALVAGLKRLPVA